MVDLGDGKRRICQMTFKMTVISGINIFSNGGYTEFLDDLISLSEVFTV